MSENLIKFSSLGISKDLLAVISGLRLVTPTPIQEKAIPPALEGNDIIGIAQTGTGKTFAFGIPILERLVKDKESQAVILLPTRELALQVEENIKKLNTIAHLPVAALIGGENIDRQLYMIRRGLRIIIATPGRIADHLKRKSLKLDKTCILVLDEGDMMLDMGFLPQVEEIMAYLPKERQTMLFSATMPSGIVKLAARHLKTPVRIEVAPAGTAAEQVEQEIYLVKSEDKLRHLEKILQAHKGSVLVFMRTKYAAKATVKKLKALSFSATEIHSNLTQSQRKNSLEGFKSGKYRIMVGTDIAARGLDVNGIELVVNYNLPDNLEDYVHRIGRTGRAGKKGKSISLVTQDERRQIREIERLIKKSIPLKELSQVKFPERLLNIVQEAPAKKSFIGNRDNSVKNKKFSKVEPFKKKSFGDYKKRNTFGGADSKSSDGGKSKLFGERKFSSNGKRFSSTNSSSSPVKNRGRQDSSVNSLFGFEKDLLPERNIKSKVSKPVNKNFPTNNNRGPKTSRNYK